MGLLANADKKVVRVTVSGGSVRFTIAALNTQELMDYRKKRYSARVGRRKQIDHRDKSSELKIELFDRKVMNAEAFDEDGNPDKLEYIDPDSGDRRELNPSVPDWTQYINAAWKIAAMNWLDDEEAEEEEAVKN